MLCILKKLVVVMTLVIHTFIFNSNAHEISNIEDDNLLIDSLSNESQNIIFSKMREIMDQNAFDKELMEEILNPRPELQIFVSSSMPKALLKSYAVEAKKYGGVLVFNGLPDGSFKKLTDLAYEIFEEDSIGLQIDDESFRSYKIEQVPTIILAKANLNFSKNPEKKKFDKIAGAITIKGALEIFANNGDMAFEARRLLKCLK